MATGSDVVELHGDAHAPAGLAHTAFDHIADAKFVGNLLQVDRLSLVDERGITRDDEEPAKLRQRGDDVLADAVGEIILRWIVGHVGERQHGDGRPVRQRQSRARRLAAIIRRIGMSRRTTLWPSHVADKAEAFASDGADQFLLVAAVADRLARGVDAAGQSRIRHDPAAPDRSEEIVLADDAVAVLHQVDQEIEDLGFHGNGLGTAAQLPPVGIKPAVGKEKFHVAAPYCRHRQPTSRNNQAHLTGKSRTGQSL